MYEKSTKRRPGFPDVTIDDFRPNSKVYRSLGAKVCAWTMPNESVEETLMRTNMFQQARLAGWPRGPKITGANIGALTSNRVA